MYESNVLNFISLYFLEVRSTFLLFSLVIKTTQLYVKAKMLSFLLGLVIFRCVSFIHRKNIKYAKEENGGVGRRTEYFWLSGTVKNLPGSLHGKLVTGDP